MSAVTVAGEWRQRGLGVLLMRHLITQASENGFRQTIWPDATDNEPMRDLANYLGFRSPLDARNSTPVIHPLDS